MAFLKFFHFSLCFAAILVLVTFHPTLRLVWFAVASFFLLLSLASWLMSFSRKFILNPRMSSKGKAVLITGCDTGIGFLLAQRLDRLGYHVFAGCLNATGEGAKNLKKTCSIRLQTLSQDVTSDKSVQDSLEYVKQNLKNNVLWAVVNNAGVGQAGEIEWTPIEEFQKAHEVNAMGLVRVTKAFLPLLRQSKGRVINNTSMCAHITFPCYVGYCMSKWTASSFTNGLRMEMHKWGVKSISVEAFFYRTPITTPETNLKLIDDTWERASDDVKQAYGDKYITAFKNCGKRLFKRSSENISEVIYCLEDAIVSSDPLNAYNPCYFPHKLGLNLLIALPRCVAETYLRLQMPRIKPAGLDKIMLKTKNSPKNANNGKCPADGSIPINQKNDVLSENKNVNIHNHNHHTKGD